MTPCMGGWCKKRDKCPHHKAESDEDPAERLCVPSSDGLRLVDAGLFRTIRMDIFERRAAEVE